MVLVEIKARFDEEANIIWARKLERAGAHVVYGLVGLKTHSKTALVVRREGSGLRRYVHIGTGNYNPKTARLYVDLGLAHGPPEIGADVTDLFNVLTGLSRQRTFRRLLVAPTACARGSWSSSTARSPMPQAGRPARIVFKLNAIVDTAGHRGAVPRAPGRRGHRPDRRAAVLPAAGPARDLGADPRSARSSASSWSTRASGASRTAATSEWYIGSADLMDRNLDRRVEAVVPVEDHDAEARIAEIIEIMLADDRRSWQLQPDATWLRTEELEGRPARSTRSRCSRSGALASGTRRPTRRVGRAPGPGRWIRGRDGGRAADGGRAQVPRARARGRRTVARRRGRSGRSVPSAAARAAQHRGPLRGYRRRGAGPGGLRGAAAPGRRRDGRHGQVARREDGPGGSTAARSSKGPADRTAGPDWPASARASLVLELAGDAPLVELVTVRQLRRKRQLKSAADRVELSLDEVDVVARGRVVDRFVELEAELTKGDEAR